MKTIVVLKGNEKNKCSFHNLMEKRGIFLHVVNLKDFRKYVHTLIGCSTMGDVEYSIISDTLEANSNILDLGYEACASLIEGFVESREFVDIPELMVIENADSKLRKAIEDDFPVFEIELVDRDDVSSTSFTLNMNSENFSEEAVELITKLAI
jgi:hypothetical protein